MYNKFETNDKSEPVRIALFRFYLLSFTFLIALGWTLSWLGALNWDIYPAIIGLFAIAIHTQRRISSWQNLAEGVKEPMFWPFLFLAGMMLITAVSFPPTMLDSLTYRLPRIWLWLQDNHVHFFNSADSRLDYMPQGWELATVPLVQLADDKLVWLWSFISWVVMYFVTYDWAFDISGDKKKARSMAFIAIASSFAVLQGRSSATDLVGATMIALALYFIIRFERTRQWGEIAWAILSFCLATNIKPHFSVFGVAVVIWFLASPSKPWKAFKWVWAPLLLAVWLISSAVPSFVLNQQHYGSITGPGQDDSIKGKSSLANVAVGGAMVVWQSIQFPINPVALALNPTLLKISSIPAIKEEVPRFVTKIPVVNMVDNASFGTILSILITVGIYLAVKARQLTFKNWQTWAALGSVACTILTLTHFVSSGAGRAYYGFLFVLVPLAMMGWNLFSPKLLRYGLYLSLVSSLLLLIFDPSRPLWPVVTVERVVAQYPSLTYLDAGLKRYLLIPERASVAKQLIDEIPRQDRGLAAFISKDSPLLPLFRPYSFKREIKFFSPHTSPDLLQRSPVDYVIIDSAADEFYPEICNFLKTSADYEPVASRSYTAKITRGAQVWTLYRRVDSPGNLTWRN